MKRTDTVPVASLAGNEEGRRKRGKGGSVLAAKDELLSELWRGILGREFHSMATTVPVL